ncbi:N-acetyl-alpha-D-glucosaminyl L-malate synthase BshA [Pullulanibacillus sp. KACC 23026]|uniref:N-acetyl-alpha-D-glucosaminyl L-malate synthase BshA n=1 Tax=Pullulanibacillus sp. KACC 23026 TaxID=3028315 RepID=UPI0023B189CD|nr:N-acetyl-alpha-D-glucosaminyl L-malate synthase BshA [Pullulanibacillus sp. KACC 23026]WEG11339.1 N-acetyl-alpha-D-glucosaminyl L-malate synthase BshA [Pullulanibacillus sp. KACC 23026]
MKTLKIGITCYPTVGGSGVVATELGKKLADRGHEVHFITSSIPFRLDTFSRNIFFHEVEVNQYAVFRYPPYDLTLASKMAEVAVREKLDILHVHYAVPHAVCAFLAKQMVGDHLKIVTTLHGTDITVLGFDPTLKAMIRFGIENSDCVTAVSHDLVVQTKELLETEREIVPIHNFVDESIYFKREDNGLKEAYHISPEEKVLTHISNFREVKRVPDVVKTFAKVREKLPAKLLLIGEGPELPRVTRLVKELGLSQDVLFLGRQENVAEILSISDLALLLSSKESFGLILLEAASCGVPAIGTYAGGIPEVVKDGYTGYLVEIGDVEAASQKAIHLLSHPELHEQMGYNALSVARNEFLSSRIVEQYEKVYEDVLKDKKAVIR